MATIFKCSDEIGSIGIEPKIGADGDMRDISMATISYHENKKCSMCASSITKVADVQIIQARSPQSGVGVE
jgi:hypothetical protein